MAISARLRDYLELRGIPYEVIPHPHTEDSRTTAAVSRVPAGRLAKAVLLEDDEGYLLAAVPASERLHLSRIHNLLRRPLGLATEAEIARMFPDCAVGAVPPVAAAFDLPAVVDERLLAAPEIWFEAGDHEDLVHLDGEAFRRLMGDAPHGDIGTH
jgi:Ala-tRNA(Pro) deacylase